MYTYIYIYSHFLALLPELLLIVYKILSADTWELSQMYQLAASLCFIIRAEGTKTKSLLL